MRSKQISADSSILEKWFVYGVTVLGLSPDAFWQLSLTEWRWLRNAAMTETDTRRVDGATGPGVFARRLISQELRALMEKYPDKDE